MDPNVYKLYERFNKEVPEELRILREDFVEFVNEVYMINTSKGEQLKEGYAPFCKHMIIENFNEFTANTTEITPENIKYLKTGYFQRNKGEASVLMRWLDATKVKQKKAKYLDIILYTKEQIQLELKATKKKDANKDVDYEYVIVGIKPQDEDFETPMLPITMMRNASGKDQGGSGVPIDPVKYKESVEYWEKPCFN